MENKVYILDTDILNDDEIYNKLYSAREFDSFIYQNNLAGLIKPTFFMSIF